MEDKILVKWRRQTFETNNSNISLINAVQALSPGRSGKEGSKAFEQNRKDLLTKKISKVTPDEAVMVPCL